MVQDPFLLKLDQCGRSRYQNRREGLGLLSHQSIVAKHDNISNYSWINQVGDDMPLVGWLTKMLCSGMFHALGRNMRTGAFSNVGTSSGWNTPFVKAITLWSPGKELQSWNSQILLWNEIIWATLYANLPFTVLVHVGQWPSSKSTWTPSTPEVNAVMKWMEFEGDTSPRPKCWHCRRGGRGAIFQSSSECNVDNDGRSSLPSNSKRLYLLVRRS